MKKYAALLTCFLVTACALIAQNITGSIVGQITDSSGSALPGTAVVVRNQGTGITVEAAVDASGSYTVPNLFAGQYTISARNQGFNSVEIKDVQLLASQTARQDISLQVGEVRQTIEVSPDALRGANRLADHRQYDSAEATL